jgi:hypothetical protein
VTSIDVSLIGGGGAGGAGNESTNRSYTYDNFAAESGKSASVARTIGGLYNTILYRKPEYSGLNFWCAGWNGDVSATRNGIVAAALGNSEAATCRAYLDGLPFPFPFGTGGNSGDLLDRADVTISPARPSGGGGGDSQGCCGGTPSWWNHCVSTPAANF